jgi:hypothetical protein
MKILFSAFLLAALERYFQNFSVLFLCIGSVLVFSATLANGQNTTDSITVKRTFGTVFQQHGENLTPGKLLEITQSNTEAYNEMKLAKSNYNAGYVIGFAGGALVGWPVGTALAGGDPNWTLAAVGAGLIVVSIPFSSAYIRHAKKAVSIFNSQLKQLGLNRIDLKIGCTNHGVGLSINF